MNTRTWLSGIISGLLLGSTTLTNGLAHETQWIIFFGFLPLWSYWLEESRLEKILLSGWLTQFIFSLIAFHWLAHTVNEFGHLGKPLSLFTLLLFCAVANFQFPLAGLIWAMFFRKPKFSTPHLLASLALITALCQRLGSIIFPWNFGYAWLYMNWPAAQTAELFGFRFLCTVSILINALLLTAWIGRKRITALLPMGAALGIFAVLNVAGNFLLHRLPPPDASLKVLMIQPNITNLEKEKLEREENFRETIIRRYFDLTDKGLTSISSPPDFALWPENAFPGIIADPELTFGLSPILKQYLVARKLNLITGSFGLNGEFKTTNSIFAISKQGKWSSPPYHKRILLPFGEYVPGSDYFPILKKWLPYVRDFGRGSKPLLLDIQGIKIGPQICYEGLFDSEARELALKGAQIFVNVTNDSWYGTWLEPWQHLYLTIAKAVETRRPLIRATNTGISTVALANGSLSQLSPNASSWTSTVEVPFRRIAPTTFFMRWGYWTDWFFLLVGLLLTSLSRIKRKFFTRRAQ